MMYNDDDQFRRLRMFHILFPPKRREIKQMFTSKCWSAPFLTDDDNRGFCKIWWKTTVAVHLHCIPGLVSERFNTTKWFFWSAATCLAFQMSKQYCWLLISCFVFRTKRENLNMHYDVFHSHYSILTCIWHTIKVSFYLRIRTLHGKFIGVVHLVSVRTTFGQWSV